MKQLILDWLICSMVMVIIFVTITTLCADDQTDYLKARAAIAIHASMNVVVEVKPPAKAKAAKRPTIAMYSTANCQPCATAKSELKATKDLPFDVVFDAKPTINVESFPTFHWSNERGHWQTSGWDGVEKLEATWKSSQEPLRRSQTSTRYRARWTWPGDLRQHLRATHGVTDALTQEQAERVHDALHEGYTVSQIRAYAKSRGWR